MPSKPYLTPSFAGPARSVGIVLLALVLAGCIPATAAPGSPTGATGGPTSTASAAASPDVSARSTSTVVPASTPGATAHSAPSVAPATASADEEFSGERALADVQWLANQVGSRPAGSDSERQAAEAMAERLRTLGYTVELQPFPVTRFEDRGSALSAGELAPNVQVLMNSAAGQVSGRLVHVGLGRTTDLEGQDLRGTIALIERGEITFGEKTANVAAAGALGAVIYNREPGSFQGAIQELAAIPVVAISQQDGQALIELLAAQPLDAELQVDASVVESTSHNVVATLDRPGEARVVLGAHYDSVEAGPGANDNASGTATVLELARVLPAQQLPYDLAFVLFGAEEIGLVGSRQYVAGLTPQQREHVVAMLNFDMVGVGERPLVGGSDDLVELAQAQAQEQGLEVGELGSALDGRSDHGSFLEAGIPAVFFHRGDDPRYHTAEDQAQYVAATALDQAGELALALLEQVAEVAPE